MGRLSHHLLQALQSLRLAPYASTITVLTVAASLCVSGGIWLGGKALESGLSQATAKPRMTLFLAEWAWELSGDQEEEQEAHREVHREVHRELHQELHQDVHREAHHEEQQRAGEKGEPSKSSELSDAPIEVSSTPQVALAHKTSPPFKRFPSVDQALPQETSSDSPHAHAAPGNLRELQAQITSLAGGEAQAKFVSSDEALSALRESLGSMGSALDSLIHNPLPDSIELYLPFSEHRSVSDLRVLSEKLLTLPAVVEVDYGDSLLQAFESMLQQVRRISLTVFASVLALALFLIANVVRLSVYARREEIEILRLVGASKLFIALPFLIEGALVGLFGGTLAALGIWGLFQQLFANPTHLLTITQEFQPEAPSLFQGLMLLTLAVSMGVLASLAATLRFLRRAR